MMTKTDDDALSPAILSLFDRILQIELAGHTVWEGCRHDEYVETSKKVAAALGVKPWEIRALHLERDGPPPWVARFPELAEPLATGASRVLRGG